MLGSERCWRIGSNLSLRFGKDRVEKVAHSVAVALAAHGVETSGVVLSVLVVDFLDLVLVGYPFEFAESCIAVVLNISSISSPISVSIHKRIFSPLNCFLPYWVFYR